MKVQYAIDNFLFETDSRKIYVTSSKGMLDNPEPKEPFKVDYPFRHGEEVFWSPNEVMYKARNITIECFIVASSNSDLITQFNALCAVFRGQMGKKLRRLYVQVDTLAPLFYDVYLSGKIELEKKWSQGQIVGKFTLNLVEPYPTKVSYHLSGLNYQIGSRNLLTNSDFSDNAVSWALHETTFTKQITGLPSGAISCGKFIPSGASRGVYKANVRTIAGRKYTVSFFAKADFPTSLIFSYEGVSISSHLYLSTVWQSYNYTFIGDGNEHTLTFYIQPTVTNFYLTNVKLELGEIATNWQRAPEDIVSIAFTLTNTSAKKKKFNVLFDGILSTSAQSFVLNAGASTAVSQNVSGEFLACVRNPVFSIDDPNHTVTNGSLTITKPYLL